ncbi:iron-sulfur cluster assembly scaffold protein [Gemmata obscuriglobus]|nr:iron-sulfur cluster assembly scaffold protein [Gemmata obscuriglobus]VTS11169.1 Uncharacterized protein OS=Staphylococcus equorum UMC-CNS-924 GN=SEQU_11525 PE=4 SV=1: Fe-S_biosyn [Gemmata obscuriglobus UQM 2246]
MERVCEINETVPMIRAQTGPTFALFLVWLTGCDMPVRDARPRTPAPSLAGPALELAPPPRERVYLEITPAAAHELRTHVAGLNIDRWWLRYTIKGGGCTGFQNKLDIEAAPPGDDDFEFVVDGIRCVVLEWQRPYARGTRIDFGAVDGNRGFIVTFPQSRCPQNAAGKSITDEFEQRAAHDRAAQQK